MSSRKTEREPPRLVDGELGNLLRTANQEFTTDLDQPAAFRRITERLSRSQRRRFPWGVHWLVPVAPLASAALAAILALSYRQRLEAPPELVAESWHPSAKVEEKGTAPAPAASSDSEETLSKRDAPKKAPRASKRGQDGTSVPAAAPVTPSAPASATPSDLREGSAPEPTPRVDASTEATVSPAPDCLSFARQGQTRAAENCFLERAQGSGLAAEMALYEVARLRRDVLADSEGALRALSDYRRRFPAGSLRREVDMSQLELLLKLGRSDDALQRSEELLASSAAGERALELRLLRGHILRKQSRFAAALVEYDLAEGMSARSGEATYFRAVCLEALGRSPEAAATLTRYLEQPQRPYAEDARRRLERLKP
jgi:hypothetical protein